MAAATTAMTVAAVTAELSTRPFQYVIGFIQNDEISERVAATWATFQKNEKKNKKCLWTDSVSGKMVKHFNSHINKDINVD